MLYYSIVSAIFAYILYTYIDPGLIEKMLAMTEETMLDKGIPESAIEQGMKIQEKVMVPWVLSLGGILNGLLFGTIISLILSIFIKREGNPLIDDSIEE